MSFGEAICGREAIARALGIDRRAFTNRVNEGAVADDDQVVSGQYVIPGLGRVVREGHSSYALQPTFRLPDASAPVRVAMPKIAHYTTILRDGVVFATVKVERGQRPGVTLCEGLNVESGKHEWTMVPLDQKMQPLPDWPSCPPPGDYM